MEKLKARMEDTMTRRSGVSRSGGLLEAGFICFAKKEPSDSDSEKEGEIVLQSSNAETLLGFFKQ
jgi:hypothetical protein